MGQDDRLAAQFETHRTHLRAVAYRMLGSLNEAEDAVQEAWLRFSRARESEIDNPPGWLTTTVARVCLDMLRTRKARREESLATQPSASAPSPESAIDPEQEAVLAESVGLALLIVLETLEPAERLAFVLHDLFGMSFEEISSIVGRSAAAARQLASRARRRVQGRANVQETELTRQRQAVDAFLAALRAGDLEGLVAVLDPDVVVRADTAATRPGAPSEVRGARNWAKGAIAFAQAARFTQPAIINGTVGVVVAPRGRLFRVLRFTFANGRIAKIDVIAEPETLRRLELAAPSVSRSSR